MRVAEDLLIDIVRNPNAPVFLQTFYVATVSETEAQGASILQVSADDRDGDSINFEIELSSQQGVNAQEFFYINPSTGVIFIRKQLSAATTAQYLFTVIPRDNGYPQRVSQASVQINIVRDGFPPVFSRSNYQVTILEGQAINDTIETVSATDDNIQVSLLSNEELNISFLFQINKK